MNFQNLKTGGHSNDQRGDHNSMVKANPQPLRKPTTNFAMIGLEVIDKLITTKGITGTELKVYLYLYTQTVCFQKDYVKVSASKIADKIESNKANVLKATSSLINRGLVDSRRLNNRDRELGLVKFENQSVSNQYRYQSDTDDRHQSDTDNGIDSIPINGGSSHEAQGKQKPIYNSIYNKDKEEERKKVKASSSKKIEELDINEEENTLDSQSKIEENSRFSTNSQDQTNDTETSKANPPFTPSKEPSSLLGKNQENGVSVRTPEEEKEKTCAKKEKEEEQESSDEAVEFFKSIFGNGFSPYRHLCNVWFDSYGRDIRMIKKVLTSEVPSFSMKAEFQERKAFARDNALAHLLNNPKESEVLSSYLKRQERLKPKNTKSQPEAGYDCLLRDGRILKVVSVDSAPWIMFEDGIELNEDKIVTANNSRNAIDLNIYIESNPTNAPTSSQDQQGSL